MTGEGANAVSLALPPTQPQTFTVASTISITPTPPPPSPRPSSTCAFVGSWVSSALRGDYCPSEAAVGTDPFNFSPPRHAPLSHASRPVQDPALSLKSLLVRLQLRPFPPLSASTICLCVSSLLRPLPGGVKEPSAPPPSTPPFIGRRVRAESPSHERASDVKSKGCHRHPRVTWLACITAWARRLAKAPSVFCSKAPTCSTISRSQSNS